jgi:hypothetical protein
VLAFPCFDLRAHFLLSSLIFGDGLWVPRRGCRLLMPDGEVPVGHVGKYADPARVTASLLLRCERRGFGGSGRRVGGSRTRQSDRADL